MPRETSRKSYVSFRNDWLGWQITFSKFVRSSPRRRLTPVNKRQVASPNPGRMQYQTVIGTVHGFAKHVHEKGLNSG